MGEALGVWGCPGHCWPRICTSTSGHYPNLYANQDVSRHILECPSLRTMRASKSWWGWGWDQMQKAWTASQTSLTLRLSQREVTKGEDQEVHGAARRRNRREKARPGQADSEGGCSCFNGLCVAHTNPPVALETQWIGPQPLTSGCMQLSNQFP